MEKEKKNVGVIALMGVIILILLVLCILFATGKLTFNASKPSEEKEEEKIQEPVVVELTREELMDKLAGEWGTCVDGSCFGIMVSKKDDNTYSYTSYLMWSDGINNGVVTDTSMAEENKYNVTVYFPPYEDMMNTYYEHTNNYLINISDIESNVIYIGDTKYQKITTDRESFFNSIR